MQLFVFLSFQEQRGREERRRRGFSVALNIFLYCEKCSMFMCLHASQGGEMNNRGLVIGSIRRTCSFLFLLVAPTSSSSQIQTNASTHPSLILDARFDVFSERFSFPRAWRWCVSVRWSQVCSPRRLQEVQLTIGWGFCCSHWAMMREKLGSERMGSPVFIEKASADERMNGCRAGCLHAQRSAGLAAPSAGGCGSCCFLCVTSGNTAHARVCVTAVLMIHSTL